MAAPDGDEFDLCALDELREKAALAFEFEHPRFGLHEIAVFWDGERVGALDNYCPHEGAMLSHGVVELGQVVCPLHAAVFDVTTGECSTDTPTTRKPTRPPSAAGASGSAPPASAASRERGGGAWLPGPRLCYNSSVLREELRR